MPDVFGNYIGLYGVTHPPDPTGGFTFPQHYPGNPNGIVTAAINTVLIDTLDMSWWQNTDGGTTWVAVSSGSGPGPSLIAPGVVNPERVVTAAAGSIYFNTNNSTFWEKATGSGNTGWVQLI